MAPGAADPQLLATVTPQTRRQHPATSNRDLPKAPLFVMACLLRMLDHGPRSEGLRH
ncbi:MAG: hypothetical protein P8M25_09480 [Paracoccaceae bacterium]|nr:hypothetical protein [Paracoccaceae bacterium]